MKEKILLLLLLLPFVEVSAQDRRGIFVHAEYQFLKYDYLQAGIGFHPKKHLVNVSSTKEQYCFIGYTLSYMDNFKNKDWGVAIQSVAYGGSYDGPLGLGIELNYKSVNQTDHYGLKPIIGLSFPVWNVMYGYNFDLYKPKTERISQHELILGFRIRVLKWR